MECHEEGLIGSLLFVFITQYIKIKIDTKIYYIWNYSKVIFFNEIRHI